MREILVATKKRERYWGTAGDALAYALFCGNA
jgi:hypothetical protein